MTRTRVRTLRSLSALALAVVVGASGQVAVADPQNEVAEATPTFKTQVGGTYDGMPVFDGVPAHADAYMDAFFDYTGERGLIRFALQIRRDYVIEEGPNAGKVVPGAYIWNEGVQGHETDFPAVIGMGNSWNTDLYRRYGDAAARELLSSQGYDNSSAANGGSISNTKYYMMVMSDIRANPLSGRVDESFAEDAYLADTMVHAVSTGLTGVEDEGNEDGFWIKAGALTKHYTNYGAQWFRTTGDVDTSARAILDYHARTVYQATESGSIIGNMPSFARTNGVPNTVNPLLQALNERSKWGNLQNTPDIWAETHLWGEGEYANGVDTQYLSRGAGFALMMLAESSGLGVEQSGANATAYIDFMQAELAKGTLGVTIEDVRAVAKSVLLPLVRTGQLNERDENNVPLYYPFTDAYTVETDSTTPENQELALQAADEALVLLKNEDADGNPVLPLATDADVAVVGPHSQAVFKTTYAVRTTPEVENAALTAAGGIATVGEGETHASTDGAHVVLRSAATGKYLTFDTEATTDVFVHADADDLADAATFESFAWGQGGAYSFNSLETGKWLNLVTSGGGWSSPATPQSIQVNGDVSLRQEGAELTAVATTASLPARFRLQENADGTVSLLTNVYNEAFMGINQSQYYTGGRFLTVDEEGLVAFTGPLVDDANAAVLNTVETKFHLETVQPTGTDAAGFRAEGAEYAVVVVGNPPRNSSGEGMDRRDLYLGADQYELVDAVADAYPGKTIVVINAQYPVIAEEIQNNANVAAVLFQPYAGQYSGYAVGRAIFGESNPSGKVTSTWYADMSALPAIDEYSIPEGSNATVSLADIDPTITVDMSVNDPQLMGLTYMYTEAPVTYEFGHGLSYSEFTYSAPQVQATSDGFTASVTVTNDGTRAGAEVVQVYATNQDTAYGDTAPARRLVGFDKVSLDPGQSQVVTVPVAGSALEVWDVVSGDYLVESGTYRVEIGASSADPRATVEVEIEGSRIGNVDAVTAPVSVFDKGFDYSDVTFVEASKVRTVENLADGVLVGGYHAVAAKAEGAWAAMKNVDLDGARGIVVSAASSSAEGGALEIRLDGPDGALLAQVEVAPKSARTLVMPATVDPAADETINEIAYADHEVDFAEIQTGVHDLYIVFTERDTRIDTVQLKVATQRFSDVPLAHPFFAEIDWLAAGGITTGYEDGTFGPSLRVSRQAIAAYLYRYAGDGWTPVDGTQTFPDVPVDHPFYTEIEWLADAGVVTGYEDGTFLPANSLSRQAMAALFFRLAEVGELDAGEPIFSDVPVDHPFFTEIQWFFGAGLTTGYGDGTFRGGGEVSRQAMAAFLMRFDEAQSG